MTAWVLATRAVHQLGGSATSRQVEHLVGMGFNACEALGLAQDQGLVTHSHEWRFEHSGTTWHLTAKGRAFAENRLQFVRRTRSATRQQRRPLVFLPTWLASLPDDIRL